jgi:hypothetical protein
MWTREGNFIWKNINNYIFILFIYSVISCAEPQNKYSISCWVVYMGIPTKEEWKTEYTEYGNPLITFMFKIKNETKKKMVLFNESFFDYPKIKSKTYLISKGKLYPLISLRNRAEFKPDSSDKHNNQVGLHYNAIYPGKIPSEINLDSLLKKTEEIAKDGTIIYVPNMDDYKDLDTNIYTYPKQPMIIKRLTNVIIKGDYLYKVKNKN